MEGNFHGVKLLGRANVCWKKEHDGNVENLYCRPTLVWSHEECPTGELTVGELQFQLPQSWLLYLEVYLWASEEAQLTPIGWRKFISSHKVQASLIVGDTAEILRWLETAAETYHTRELTVYFHNNTRELGICTEQN